MSRTGGAAALTAEDLRAWPIEVDGDADKLGRGSVLVIGGSSRTPGAVLLAGLGALRVGCGRLQLATVAEAAGAMAIAVPEALVEPLPQREDGSLALAASALALLPHLAEADAVLLGPGLDHPASTIELLGAVIDALPTRTPLVLDALALDAARSLGPSGLESVTGRLIFTPNRGEAFALMGVEGGVADGELVEMIADRYGATVTVHGEICEAGGRRWRVPAGSVGLATSGSGDVLAGFVAGLAALTDDAAQAVCFGTYLHSVAGDRLAAEVGRIGFLARELLDLAPRLLDELRT